MPPGKTFACQLRNSASGSIGLMCAQKILKAAKIGTAKIMPTIPHIQPQKVSERRMMTGFKVRERPINPWGDETALQGAKSEIDGRKNEGVPQAIEAQDGADGHADDACEGAQIRDEIEQRHHHTPHYGVAQPEQAHRSPDGQSKAGINRCDSKEITRDM